MTKLFELSKEEIKRRGKLNKEELKAVATFIYAAQDLPKTICIEVNDGWDGEPNLIVKKRITDGFCRQVASLKKKSLCF